MRAFSICLLLITVSCFGQTSQREVRSGRTAYFQTGFDNTGGVHLWGPGIDTHGAYRFEDICDQHPQPGLLVCYRVTVVLDEPVSGMPPDIVYSDTVQVWGTLLGHFIWQCGPWKLEMNAIDEAIRQQVSWGGEARGYAPGPGSVQTVNITVGRNVITFLARQSRN